MRIEVVRAWPRRHELRVVELAAGATVADAVLAAGLGDDPESVGVAVHGVAASPDSILHDGDRVELLRPLVVDPREARRRRAGGRMR